MNISNVGEQIIPIKHLFLHCHMAEANEQNGMQSR